MGLSSRMDEANKVYEMAMEMMRSHPAYATAEAPSALQAVSEDILNAEAAPSAPPRKKKKIYKIKGGVALSTHQVIKMLKSRGVSEELIDKFINEKHDKGWTASEEKAYNTFVAWDEARTKAIDDEKEPRSDPEPAPVPAPAPAPAPAPVKGAFKLSEKEYHIIRNSNPRYEWKILLKEFFNEMSITTYGRIPAQFIKDVNALNIKGAGTTTQLEKLQALIAQFKPSVTPEVVPETKTKKLNKPSAVKKEKKGKKSLVTIKKTKVKRLPKPDKVKKVKKPKKATKKSTKKLVDEIVVYS